MRDGLRLLKALKWQDEILKSLQMQIELEESRLTDISVHYKDIQIQSSNYKNALEEKCPEIVELMNSLDKCKKDLASSKNTAMKVIKELPEKYQAVLMYYYMQNKSLEQTAELMDKSYTWIFYTLRDAEDAFDILYKNL